MADACSSSMAGSSSTSYSRYYDVFINYCGTVVNDTFATPLYHSLLSSGLKIFLDNPEIHAGHDIPPQIEEAIRVAPIHIVIFSPSYAESKWWQLDELLLMVESVKSGRATILPIFYKVKPSDLRYGAYAEALCSHEEKKLLRDALSFVANISGFEVEAVNGDEEELLDEVVQSVLKITPTHLDVGKSPTGLEEKLLDFERCMLSRSQGELRAERCMLSRSQGKLRADSAKVVGIVGVGGIGKTTLANYFFKRKRSNYKGSSFLFDVRDNAHRGNLSSLQRQLIKELQQKEIKIDSVEEGIQKLERHLVSFHALVILDDVDHADQLCALLRPIKDVLDPNSLILVTSRDMYVFRCAEISASSIYHLRGLNSSQSEQLFCSHAFSSPDPPPGFEHLVSNFIMASDGLPLTLKVFGALLHGENDFSYFEELLDRLSRIKRYDICTMIKFSYYSLNEEEQQIFLDIACFAIGDDRDKWLRIWGGSGWEGLVGFAHLQRKGLVMVDYQNRIKMHDTVRDMGRKRERQRKGYGGLSVARRLYDLQYVGDWLEQSSREVRGLAIPWVPCDPMWAGITELQLLKAEGDFVEIILTMVHSPNLIWLCWHHCPYPSLPCSIPMHDLRVLEVYGTKLERLWQCESEGPVQLRELIIDAPLVEFPKSLGYLKQLEKIVARNTSLATFPEEFSLPSLKYLELHGCQFQRLWQCRSQGPLQLRELIIDAPLVKFPKSLWQLKHLVKIVAEETCLATLPEEFCYLPCLKFLLLKDYKMLPDYVGRLTTLQLTDCRSLEMLSRSMDNLTNHQLSGLEQCTSLEMLLTAIVWRFFQNPSSI